MTPTRYLAHGQQIMAAYLQQLARSSYVASCAAFQTADQLRRVQRVAYRTKQLEIAHPTYGFGSSSEKPGRPIRFGSRCEGGRAYARHFQMGRGVRRQQPGGSAVVRRNLPEALRAVAEKLDDPLNSLIADDLYREFREGAALERRFLQTCDRSRSEQSGRPDESSRKVATGRRRHHRGGRELITRQTPDIVAGVTAAEIRSFLKTLHLSADLRPDA